MMSRTAEVKVNKTQKYFHYVNTSMIQATRVSRYYIVKTGIIFHSPLQNLVMKG